MRIPKSANITTHLNSLHWFPVQVKSTYKIDTAVLHHHMSLICSRNSSHFRKIRSSSHTMPLLNRLGHMEIAHFILHALFEILFQILSGLCPITVIVSVSCEGILVSFSLQRPNLSFYICACFSGVIDLLTGFSFTLFPIKFIFKTK